MLPGISSANGAKTNALITGLRMFWKCYVVPTTISCNASCVFCSTKSKRNRISAMPQYMSVGDSFNNIIHRLAALGVYTFEITGGGEPFLHQELQTIIDRIRNAVSGCYIRLYTNGLVLKSVINIDELVLSVVHWDASINDRYVHPRRSIPPLDILRFFSADRAFKLRLSVPLLRGAIDSEATATELITRTSRFVDEYVFRPLSHATHPAVKRLLSASLSISDARAEVDYRRCVRPDILWWWPDNKLYEDWEFNKCLE